MLDQMKFLNSKRLFLTSNKILSHVSPKKLLRVILSKNFQEMGSRQFKSMSYVKLPNILVQKSVLTVLLGTKQYLYSIINKFLDTDVKSRNAFRKKILIPKKPKKHFVTTFSNLICTTFSPMFHFIFILS